MHPRAGSEPMTIGSVATGDEDDSAVDLYNAERTERVCLRGDQATVAFRESGSEPHVWKNWRTGTWREIKPGNNGQPCTVQITFVLRKGRLKNGLVEEIEVDFGSNTFHSEGGWVEE